MSFVYPQFLWGLLALSIPIIIHLFNFRRTRRVYFSNTAFLRDVKEATTSKLKLKHLLILLARLAFVTFLVLTFAQPFIPGNAGSDVATNKLVYLYLDNSLSMASELASGVRSVDQGVSVIDEITRQYPRNTQYKLLTNQFGDFSRVPKNNEELTELTTGVDLAAGARTAQEVVDKVQNDRQSAELQGATAYEATELYVISDFQKSTLGSLLPLKADTALRVNLVPVVNSFSRNLYVDSVYLDNPFMLAGQANELTVSVRNQGEDAVENLIVRLLINEQQVANASVDIDAFSSAELRFPLNFPLEANNRCAVQFEDYPATFDNEFFFTLNLGDKIRVLEVTTTGQGTSNVARVYANEQLFDFESFGINNLDYSQIEEADLVVLNEVGGVSAETSRAIAPYVQAYLEGGGHLIFVMPATGDVSFLRQATGNQGLAAERVPLPDSVGTAPALANPDLANPFFTNMFEGEETNFEMPAAVSLVNHNLRGEAYLRYRTGDPYLFALRNAATAAQQIFVFSTPLRQEFTNLYRHGIFVPVMYRLASMGKSLETPLYYSVAEPTVTLRTRQWQGSEDEGGADVYRLRHSGQEVIPAQRLVNQRLMMELPQDLLEAGFYDLVRSSPTAADSLPLVTLSFNVDAQESRIEPYSPSEIDEQVGNAPNVSLYEADDVETFSTQLRNQNNQQSFWRYTLLLALFFLLVEVLLIRFL
ncbi:MAG: BatA domain-containing protein [Tunicatimonas sp.]